MICNTIRYFYKLSAFLTILLLYGCDNTEEITTSSKPKTAFLYIIEDSHLNDSNSFFKVPLGQTMIKYSEQSGLKVSIQQVEAQEDNTHWGEDAMLIDGKPRLIPQCGIYDIFVADSGEPVFYEPNFVYSGEDYLDIAHGAGWAIFIIAKGDEI